MKIALAFVLLLNSLLIAFSAYCGNDSWHAYDKERCYKIVDQLVNRQTADALCKAQVEGDGIVPETLTIKNSAEQNFIRNLIYERSNIFDNVWLAAERMEDRSFAWRSEKSTSPLVYTNWAEGYPSNNSENGCMQVSSKASRDQIDSIDNGLWKDVPCNKRNLVICQKRATMSIPEIQALLYELKNNPVPVGFIYTQLPNKPGPTEIWPTLVWKNVTPDYAGLFFRAEGGNSGEFETIQEESTKRLTQVETIVHTYEDNWGNASIVPGEWSEFRQIGYYIANNANRAERIRFLVSGDEIKPRNTAVRFWERMQ